MLLRKQIDSFLQDHLQRERNCSAHTLRNYAADLYRFSEFVGADAQVEAIDHIRIRQFLADLYTHGAKKSSVARRLAAIRSLFRYIERERRLEKNPARLVSAPKLPRHLPSIPTAPEVNRLLDEVPAVDSMAFPARDRVIFELLYGAGIRVSELVGLNLRDIDFGVRTLLVRGKGRKERIVPFGTKAEAAIQAYLPQRADLLARAGISSSDALLLNLRGGRLTSRSVGRLVKAYALRLGFSSDLHPHSFRHAFASHLLGEGADLRAIQEMLGHKNLGTTQKYTQTDIRQLMEVYDRAHPKA